jgi:hypothetical protein
MFDCGALVRPCSSGLTAGEFIPCSTRLWPQYICDLVRFSVRSASSGREFGPLGRRLIVGIAPFADEVMRMYEHVLSYLCDGEIG